MKDSTLYILKASAAGGILSCRASELLEFDEVNHDAKLAVASRDVEGKASQRPVRHQCSGLVRMARQVPVKLGRCGGQIDQ